MDLGSRIGWGVIIYAVVYFASAGISIYGWTQGVTPYLFVLLILTLICIWAGLELRFRSWSDILPYSIGWAIIAIALDALYMVPSQGWTWFHQWSSWAAYCLVALLPLLAVYFRKKAVPATGRWET